MTSHDPRNPIPEASSLSALYRATRREEPASELDRAVLDEARRALSRRRRRWMIPVSTAAVILLGVSLTLTQFEPPQPIFSTPEPRDRAAPAGTRKALIPSTVEEENAKRKSTLQRQRSAPQMFDADVDSRLREEAFPESSETAMPTAPPVEADAPEAWLDVMQQMMERGETASLLRELQAFRRVYPDYPLPATLQPYDNRSE